MLVILQKDRFAQLLKELNGLPAETTVDELLLLGDQYGDRLYSVLEKDFGLRFVEEVGKQGSLTAQRFECTHHEIGRTVEGLQFLRPVAISVDGTDIPKLVVGKMGRDLLIGGWSQIKHMLEKIQPHELTDKLEAAAGVVLNAANKARENQTPEERLIQDSEFELWCASNGYRIPGQRQSIKDSLRQHEEAQERARREAIEKRWEQRESQESSSWNVREL